MTRIPILLLTLGACLIPLHAASGQVEAHSVILRLIEQVETPARQAGALFLVSAREGQLVKEGELLAQIDDAEARLVRQRAELDLEIARKQAENDVDVRLTRKAQAVAEADLKRALQSLERFSQSISQSELDRLRLLAEQASLEVERSQQQLEIAKITRRVRENDLEFSLRSIERHQIVAPLAGMIVQIHKRKGEWVEPGDPVLRILRIDRLRAEGFVDARRLRGDQMGVAVTLIVDLPEDPRAEFSGKLVFVNPEIDPVNNQLRVWAEIENEDLKLRPGMRGELVIGRTAR